MLTPDLARRIRSIFLQTEPYVSLKRAHLLFTGSGDRIDELMAEQGIQPRSRHGIQAVTRADLQALAVELWSLEAIEEALGDDAARVLPPSLHSRAVKLNLPEYQAAMLDYLANDKATTPGDLVSRQLHDMETDYLDVLLASVPGFAEAMNWMQHTTNEGERF